MTDTATIAARDLLAMAERTAGDRLPAVLAFAGRDAYVAFVKAWKERHAAVVAEIRAEKAFRRDKANPVDARNHAQARRQYLRAESRHLQDIRAAGKDKARAAREERLREAA